MTTGSAERGNSSLTRSVAARAQPRLTRQGDERIRHRGWIGMIDFVAGDHAASGVVAVANAQLQIRRRADNVLPSQP
jgi:hypothetical protein